MFFSPSLFLKILWAIKNSDIVTANLFLFSLDKNIKIRTYKTIILPVVLYGRETSSLTLREEHTTSEG
jgi:hypothetical protein